MCCFSSIFKLQFSIPFCNFYSFSTFLQLFHPFHNLNSLTFHQLHNFTLWIFIHDAIFPYLEKKGWKVVKKGCIRMNYKTIKKLKFFQVEHTQWKFGYCEWKIQDSFFHCATFPTCVAKLLEKSCCQFPFFQGSLA